MSQQTLLVVFVVLLVVVGFALVREVRLYKGKGSNSVAVVSLIAAENVSAVVRAPEGNVCQPKFGNVVIPGKHGRGTREVALVGMDTLRGQPAVRIRFLGDNPRAVHRRLLAKVLA